MVHQTTLLRTTQYDHSAMQPGKLRRYQPLKLRSRSILQGNLLMATPSLQWAKTTSGVMTMTT